MFESLFPTPHGAESLDGSLTEPGFRVWGIGGLSKIGVGASKALLFVVDV